MSRRRALVRSLVCVVVLVIVALVVLSTLSDRRRLAAAQAALPDARAFLANNAAYQHLEVDVEHTEDEGHGLWFTGSLPTQAECDQLEAELEKRYESADFGLMFTVLSRSPNGR